MKPSRILPPVDLELEKMPTFLLASAASTHLTSSATVEKARPGHQVAVKPTVANVKTAKKAIVGILGRLKCARNLRNQVLIQLCSEYFML